MISGGDLYTVLTAMVPLYVAMLLGYGSVRWWNIFSAVQCSGINRFVSVFAIPLLSFYFISTNNPYKMDRSFLLADTASKLVILALLGSWAKFCHGSLDWLITLFSLSTLPNTLVMGIPLLNAMYGVDYQNIMVQLVVLQSIIWYTVLLFLLELRAARILLLEQFPHTASSIVSFKIDADVVSLDGREPLQTHAEIAHDGKIRVVIRRSFSSSSHHFDPFQSPRRSSMNLDLFASPCRLSSPRQNHNHNIHTSKPITPRPSNLTGAEIYSLPTLSSQNTPPHFGFASFEAPPWSISRPSPSPISPRQSNFTNCEMYSLQSSRCPTPRESNFNNDSEQFIQSHAAADLPARSLSPPCLPLPAFAILSQPSLLGKGQPRNVNVSAVVQDTHAVAAAQSGYGLASARNLSPDASQKDKESDNDKEPQMFMWSSSTSPPVSDPALPGNSAFGMGESSVPQHELEEQAKIRVSNHHKQNPDTHAPNHNNVAGDFTFGSRTNFAHQDVDSPLSKQGPSLASTPVPTALENAGKAPSFRKPNKMPSSTVMMKLILQMVGRKLLRNPNTYASLLGIIWALLAYRFDLQMPKIISESLRILWQAGLGMAMFSLGLFMALQPRLIACGTSLAIFAMAVRFITGPAVMAASSIAVGLRGVKLHAAIVQAALPQGIVPFVFSREYDLHPDILSTAVIFGMLVALPVTILYYVLLGI